MGHDDGAICIFTRRGVTSLSALQNLKTDDMRVCVCV